MKTNRNLEMVANNFHFLVTCFCISFKLLFTVVIVHLTCNENSVESWNIHCHYTQKLMNKFPDIWVPVMM